MAKTDEFAKYRRTKHAGIATLQASFDTQSTSSSEASLKALQSAHTAQGHQLTQALSRAQDLTGQLAEQEARYSNEISGLKRLVSMMEEREQQTKEIVDNIEHEWATVGEKAERRGATLRGKHDRSQPYCCDGQQGPAFRQNIYRRVCGLHSTPRRIREEYDHMDRTLSSVLAQIEERVSVLHCGY